MTVLRLQHTSVPMPAGGADRARAFYGDVLGMKEINPPSSLADAGLVWFQASPDGQEVHVFTAESLESASAAQHLCLQVDDVDALRNRLAEASVDIQETVNIPNRPRFFVRDPFGNLIELTQITGDYD